MLIEKLKKVHVVSPEELEQPPFRAELPKIDFDREPQLVELHLTSSEARSNKRAILKAQEQKTSNILKKQSKRR